MSTVPFHRDDFAIGGRSLAASTVFGNPALAGDLDPTFGRNGVVRVVLNGRPVYIQGMTVDRNNKILVIGSITTDDTQNRISVILRYDTSGNLDSSFGDNGVLQLTVSSNSSIAVDAMNRIWLSSQVADLNSPGQPNDILLTRYNDTGTIDSSFGSQGQLRIDSPFSPNRWLIDGNGKILVLGSVAGPNRAAVARYNADGTLDTRFGNNGIATLESGTDFTAGAIDQNGKLLLSSYRPHFHIIARYNSDGTLDSSFNGNGMVEFPAVYFVALRQWSYETIAAIAITSQGKVLVKGYLSEYGLLRWSSTNWLRQYNDDGSIDLNFGTGGQVRIDSPFFLPMSSMRMLIDSEGRILLSGRVQSNEQVVYRYNANGQLDRNFDGDGVAYSFGSFSGVTIDRNNDLIAVVSDVGDASVLRLERYQGDPAKDMPTATRWQNLTPLQDAPIHTLNILISEEIRDFGFDDLTLLRDGVAVPFAGSQASIYRSVVPVPFYSLMNLGALTQADGLYELRVTVNDARDATGHLLTNGTLAIWQKGTLATPLPALDFVHVVSGVLLNGTADGDTLNGTDHADILQGFQNDDVLTGGRGRDQLYGGQGNDVLLGGRASDWLVGARGDDTLEGDMGSDRLTGGPGNDVLTGGADADAFIFKVVDEGVDTITDFQLGSDRLDLRSIFTQPQFAAGNSFEQFNRFIQSVQIGTDTEVRIDADGLGVGSAFVAIARLHNITAAALDSSHFVLKNS